MRNSFFFVTSSDLAGAGNENLQKWVSEFSKPVLKFSKPVLEFSKPAI